VTVTGEATVSFNPQRVSAATESGVNPNNTALLEANWLELWYQPKIDSQTLCFNGAEALLRMRHPHLGIVLPASFIPEDGDPRFQALSQFRHRSSHCRLARVACPTTPRRYFDQSSTVVSARSGVPGLSISAAAGSSGLRRDHRRGQRHRSHAQPAACGGSRQRNAISQVAISIDDLGTEWPDLAALEEFPFVEIKVDRAFVGGCAHDRLKRDVCRQIVHLANHYGARTVAEGVETRADFIAARDLGFDLIQGFLFARPMDLR
jgi:EAL domain-containing protein (putative c-di-GMP-specific phosphodiesterase class I)